MTLHLHCKNILTNCIFLLRIHTVFRQKRVSEIGLRIFLTFEKILQSLKDLPKYRSSKFHFHSLIPQENVDSKTERIFSLVV